MRNDMSIVYRVKLMEVNGNIKRLKVLDIKIGTLEKKVKKIKEQTKLEIKKVNDKYENYDSFIFLEDILSGIYRNAIKELEQINNAIIAKYENYYRIQLKYQVLNNKLKELKKVKIDELVFLACELLNEMKHLISINFELENRLVENNYKLIYKILKLEVMLKEKSTLLETIKQNSNDISYIASLIKKDIRNVSNSSKKEKFSYKMKELNQNGFNDIHLLDQELIILLSNISNKKTLEDNFLDYLEEYKKQLKKLKLLYSEKQEISKQLSKYEDLNKNLNFKLFLKMMLYLINLGIFSSWFSMLIDSSKDLSTQRVYETITKTYDTSSSELDEEVEYLPSCEDERSLIEYSPWESLDGSVEKYKRNCYVYDLSEVEYYDDIEKYLNPELKDQLSFIENVEIVEKIPDLEYTENKCVMKQIVQNKLKYDYVDCPELQIILMIAFSSILIVVDFYFVQFVKKDILSNNKNLRNLEMKKKKNKIKIRANKKYISEINDVIEQNLEELTKLKSELIKEYYAMPYTIQEVPKIKKKVKKLEDDSIFQNES